MAAETSPVGQGFDLETFVPYRLHRLTALLTADFFSRRSPSGAGGWPEWVILSALAGQGCMTARDICIRSGLGKTAISRAVAVLERGGWLTRLRDPEDRRVERLRLSESGHEEYRALARGAGAYASRLIRLCGASDLARLDQLLQAIEEGLLSSQPDLS